MRKNELNLFHYHKVFVIPSATASYGRPYVHCRNISGMICSLNRQNVCI